MIEGEIIISLLQFPKANKKLIMEKLQINLEPVYNEFIQTYAPPKDTKDDIQILEYEKFKYVNKIILQYFYLGARFIHLLRLNISEKHCTSIWGIK